MNRGNFSSRVPGMDPEWITIREATEIAHNIKKQELLTVIFTVMRCMAILHCLFTFSHQSFCAKSEYPNIK